VSAADRSLESWPVVVLHGGLREETTDAVVVEEPLEIRVAVGAAAPPAPLTVTMRTPGHDLELAAGLLCAEGIIGGRGDVIDLRAAADEGGTAENRVDVRLRDGVSLDVARLARTFMATSACGICGKTAVDAVFASGAPALPAGRPRLRRRLVETLPEAMRAAQPVFSRTGGLHAAALFDSAGRLLVLREDVGRHNAVDKVVGACVLGGRLPATDSVLVVSGRAGFEITQKALQGGIPVLAAVGAPSSLSLRLAARAGMTLLGFLRPGRFNIYTGAERVVE
jgi:FdhD protein